MIIAALLFAAAALALGWGVSTEYSQSRSKDATVATLPFGVAAATFVTLGMVFLPRPPAWWALVLGFVGASLLFGFVISRAKPRR
jgi:hypothetical protein